MKMVSYLAYLSSLVQSVGWVIIQFDEPLARNDLYLHGNQKSQGSIGPRYSIKKVRIYRFWASCYWTICHDQLVRFTDVLKAYHCIQSIIECTLECWLPTWKSPYLWDEVSIPVPITSPPTVKSSSSGKIGMVHPNLFKVLLNWPIETRGSQRTVLKLYVNFKRFNKRNFSLHNLLLQ